MYKLLTVFFISLLIAAPLKADAISEQMAMQQTRNLFALSYEEAEEAVSRALVEKGAGFKIGASLNGHSDDALYSYNAPMQVEIKGLQFDKPSGQWSGNLLIMSKGEVITAMPASGRFDEMAEIPMLRRTLRHTEVIGPRDIEIRNIPIGRLRSDTIRDIGSLIGKTPAHSISAFRPIRNHEIGAPPLVRKNNLVQMNYSSTGMQISTSGQAMEDGAAGNVISVKNLSSKRVVQAVVEADGSVSVNPPTALSAQMQPVNTGDMYAAN